jgi:SAM-dependent methyltransferase
MKIFAKVILSRLPMDYSFWSRLGVFRHGGNDKAEYAYRVFQQHLLRVSPPRGFVALELGPGDAVASAVITKAFGGSKSYQVDVGPYADRRLETYQNIANYCISNGKKVPDLSDANNFYDILNITKATYLTEGLKSLKEIPNESVDFIYSQSCLEHIILAEFDETIRETRRVLKPGGGASHWIDLQDHLDHGLNNLRFSPDLWESRLMADSGFYTNRLRRSQIVDIFQEAGFVCEIGPELKWSILPTKRKALHENFRALDEDDLLVRGFNILAR